MNLELLLSPPSFGQRAILTIEALAPLSLVVHMPGKFYRSQPEPSREMLYGLLENALGWHIGDDDRKKILKLIRQRHKLSEEITQSGVGFQSVLQFHVRFNPGLMQPPQKMVRYHDYWSQHLRTGGLEFFGGSREHDSRLVPLVNAAVDKKITLTDSGGRRDMEDFTDFQPGDKINFAVVRPYFPRYYSTPTPREYIVPATAFQYRVETSAPLAELIGDAIIEPAAPLYLGSSDGWVETAWKTLAEDTA